MQAETAHSTLLPVHMYRMQESEWCGSCMQGYLPFIGGGPSEAEETRDDPEYVEWYLSYGQAYEQLNGQVCGSVVNLCQLDALTCLDWQGVTWGLAWDARSVGALRCMTCYSQCRLWSLCCLSFLVISVSLALTAKPFSVWLFLLGITKLVPYGHLLLVHTQVYEADMLRSQE